MAPTAAELFKQATDKRARFADGKQGVSKQKETREFGQPYLRSWWSHFMLKLQRMRTSKFWVFGCVFSFSSKTFLPNNSIWPMVARMLAAKKGIGRKYIYICGVFSPLFSFAVTHLHCCQDQQKGKDGRIENWAKKWPIRASKRQIVKWQVFFRHDRFSTGNCVIGILRV